MVHVADLDSDTSAALARRWGAAQGHAEARCNTMHAAIREAAAHHRGAQFASNPMLLTAAMLVYDKQQRLPRSTAVLYRELVEILCEARHSVWPARDDTEPEVLEPGRSGRR